MWPEVTHGLSRAQRTQARSSPSGLSPCHPLFLELSLEKSPLLLLVLVRGSGLPTAGTVFYLELSP